MLERMCVGVHVDRERKGTRAHGREQISTDLFINEEMGRGGVGVAEGRGSKPPARLSPCCCDLSSRVN